MAVPGIREGVVRESGPSDHALARTVLRFAIALRCGGVTAAIIAASVSDGTGISRVWQVLVLGGLALWAVFFTVVAVRHGLRFPLVAGDTAVVALALLAQPRFIPVSAVVDESTWAIMLASTAIYVAQLSLRPAAGLPLALTVIVAYMVGVPVSTSQVRVLFVQAGVVSAMMELLRRGGRRADAIVADRDRERQRVMVEAARRADERHQRLQMHDSVLAVLSMVASGAMQADSPGLRRGAQQALDVVEEFAAPPASDGGVLVDLVGGLRKLVTEMSSRLDIEVAHHEAARIYVPESVALAVIGAAGEALRNIERHAGVARAVVRAERQGDLVTVEITDRGLGFDPDRLPDDRHGIKRSIVERMKVVGGSAAVWSRSGEGTRVTLRWPGD
ncbi:Signal transduction histidine kinase [Thermomonospora echinospora]|uniref:Signal transduction histidine kinase n=1 Tax=Thermomonospora echinospora TaxID=1992 RepID=A0A1H6D2H3_9ACTN|nr:ATP-binding protein [Thermomonospora echinospora]SEG78856.1 Signal transduction histidine kinase [Thermomonospora echinospora]